MPRSTLFAVATFMLMLLAWPRAAVAQRSMFTDPFRTSNWRAVQEDFMAWVERVEQEHLQSVSEASQEHHNILAAGNTIVVGAGGYDKVQDAVDAAPEGTRTIIQINPGTYKYVNIPSTLSMLFPSHVRDQILSQLSN